VPKVVAYCVLPGAKDRFVITSEAQLVQVSAAGEARVVGILIASGNTDYLCLIRTAQAVIGITGSGNMVNMDTGAVVGAVVAVDAEEAGAGEGQRDPEVEKGGGPGD